MKSKPHRSRKATRKHGTQSLIRWAILISVGIVSAAAVLALVRWMPPEDQGRVDREAGRGEQAIAGESRLTRAAKALKAGRFREAERIARDIEGQGPPADRAKLIAAEAAVRDGRPADAMLRYQELIRRDSPVSLDAAFYLAEVYRATARLEEAAKLYRRVVREKPGHIDAHARLAFLYSVTGQRWKATWHNWQMVAHRQWTFDGLVRLGDPERPIERPKFIDQCLSQQPEDPWVQMAVAQLAIPVGDFDRARTVLQRVTASRPDLIAAQAMLGELLIGRHPEAFSRWKHQLPNSANRHPDVWLVRGLQARHNGELRRAAGCFTRALQIRPEHRRATYQLGQVLTSLNDPVAGRFVSRAAMLAELTQVIDAAVASRGTDEEAMRRVTELCEATGRLMEAYAWAATSAPLFAAAKWPRRLLDRVEGKLTSNVQRTVPSADPVAQANFDEYLAATQPIGRPAESGSEPHRETEKLADASIRFAVADAGIDFIYENGADTETPGARMFESTGGGVAVLDYDADGWPDLYFTQGGVWKSGETRATPDGQYVDSLCRNLGGQQFQSISGEAGIANLGFAQGATVGDFNSDGWPDLYVANVGENRLYRNNGDGTFTDASDSIDSLPSLWTTSCVMMDLTRNGLPDLYDVNYLKEDDVFTLICDGNACSPSVFPPAPDEVYLNRGDGTFERLADATPRKEAKGLGVLAGYFGDHSFPQLFIANDQVPNFFLQLVQEARHESAPKGQACDPFNEPPRHGVRLVDRAQIHGLAYNADGLATACMGVAADDIDGNGKADLLVTNFRNEPNSLYLQHDGSRFVDATRAAGLHAASYPFVGWGAQFLDADLDGHPDLVVTNGHVDDYPGEPYHMPPQFFHNQGGVRFVPLEARQLGSYFGQKYLGRGLARLDWNRDGRVDFAVSNMGDHASLVTNRTRGAGAYLNVELVGTASARDAIGSEVMVTTDGQSWKKQLMAGDGYHASNQRVLQFGLGEATEVREIVVDWPSGQRTTISDVPVRKQLLIVEGASEVIPRRGRPQTATTSLGEPAPPIGSRE